MKPKPLPTRPQVLLEYDHKCNEAKTFDRLYEVKDSFWRQYKVQEYLDQKWKIIQHNRGNLSWLKENLARLEKYGDKQNAQKIRNRIQEFDEVYL